MTMIPITLAGQIDSSAFPPGPPGTGAVPELYSSTKDLITSLPITTGADVFYSPYSVLVPGLKAADVCIVMAQCEVTTSYGFDIGVGRMLARWPSQGATSTGYINAPVMDNVYPDLHHKALQLMAFDTGQSGDVNYALTLYAVSTAASPGQALTVEQGYGGIWALVFRSP